MPEPAKTGRPRKHSYREVVNAIFYVLSNGIKWRSLPHDRPPWPTVYGYFRRWRLSGHWQRWNRELRRRLRKKLGRNAEASAGILDSQSIKTAEGGEARGFDANKRCLGRKRHILADTPGLLLAVLVTSAKAQDRDGAKALLARFYGDFFSPFASSVSAPMQVTKASSSPGPMKPLLGCSTSSGATSRQAAL